MPYLKKVIKISEVNYIKVSVKLQVCCNSSTLLASPLFWNAGGAGSWCAESISAAVFSLQQRENIAEDCLAQEIAARAAFWLSLSQPSYNHSCYTYVFIFLISFLVGYIFIRMFHNSIVLQHLNVLFETGFIMALMLLQC